jgi:glycosyltransferase involved in cell wall biosynthesis
MKILQVIPYFLPVQSYGGPAIVAYNCSKELVKRGHEVTVYTTDTFGAEGRIDKLEETIDGIKIRRFRNISNELAFHHNIHFSPTMYFQIKNEMRSFDIIHMHDYRTLQNIFVHKYATRYDIPYALQAHGSLPKIMTKFVLKNIYDNLWGQKLLADASKVIALSKQEVEQYQNMGVNIKKIETIPNGINLEEFSTLPKRGLFRKRWGISETQPVILFLARIHKIKGLDILIDAFAGLIKTLPTTVLVLAGPDNGYLSFVKRRLSVLGIENKVLLTGPLYGPEKISAYVDADVFALPSVYEIFGISIIEACACGLPVVVTDRCGIAGLIEGQVGIVVPYNSDKLLEALVNLLNDKEKRSIYGYNGKKLAKERFNWTVIAQQVESAYLTMI